MVQLIIIGVIVGSVISIGAMGLTLTYGVTKFANIAHGDYMTLGMFFVYFFVNDLGWQTEPLGPFSFGWTLFVAIIPAALGVGAVAALADTFIFRRLRRRGGVEFVALVASIGLALMLRSIVQFIWGVEPVRYASVITPAITLPLGLKIKPDQFLIVGVMVAAAAGLYFLLYKTNIGKAMRATSDNFSLAEVCGIDTDSVRRLMWFVGGSLAAVGGTMLALQSQLKHNAGFEFLLPMFAAVILGGIGNPWGALAGGLIVGISQELSTYWLPSGLKAGVPFVVLALVLLLRPRGIFGSKI